MTTARLRPDLKARWLEALRSGEYQQTTEILRNNAGYCCLGVLCDLVNPAGWDDHKNWKRDRLDPKERESESALSNSMLGYVGISKSNEGALIRLNDEELKSFTEIAGWIEENL